MLNVSNHVIECFHLDYPSRAQMKVAGLSVFCWFGYLSKYTLGTTYVRKVFGLSAVTDHKELFVGLTA